MRRALALTLLPAALVAQAPSAAEPVVPEADHVQVKKLLLAMKVPDQLQSGFLEALKQQEAKSANLPPGFIEAFKKAFSAEDLTDDLVPVFARHLNNQEVKAALAFYTSPDGASFAAKQGQLAVDLQKEGQRFGMALALKVMQEQMAEDKSK